MSNSHKSSFRKLIAFFILAAVFIVNFSAFGQKTAAKPAKASAPKCSGAWTGVIKYTRTQSQSDNKTVERVSGRGQDTRNWQMKYDYKANVTVVEAPEKNGTSIGKASINHSFSSIEKNSAVEKNSCDRGKTWRDMTGTFTSETKTSGSGNEEANVSVGVNSDGTYSVSVGLPPIKGQTTGSQTSSFSNQCTPKEGKNLSMPATTTNIEGNSLSSDGTHRINPDDPNRISGSFSQTNYGVTETITWSLQKCGAELRIIDLKFEDMKFPNWNEWKEIEADMSGTIDGNLVKLKAKILNASGETKYADVKFKETYKGDKYNASRPDEPFENTEINVRIEAGEEKEVEAILDTEGFSWFNDGRPHLTHRIKAELEENGKKTDEMTKNLNIAPKPVVLVHGIWADYKIWQPHYQNLMSSRHGYQWKAFAVGENPAKGQMKTGGKIMSGEKAASITENVKELAKYVRYAQEEANAWHVDLVAHSTGGLVSRAYLQNMPTVPDGRPLVKHLVMLGTPNKGVPCAEAFLGKLGLFSEKLQPTKELTDLEITRFNEFVRNTRGTKLSALAGNVVPFICGGYEWNDGFITVESAKHGIADFAYLNDLNPNLVNSRGFGIFVLPHLVTGPDGKYPVPVKSDPNNWERWKLDHGNPYSPRYDPKAKIGFSDDKAGNFSSTDPQTFMKEIKVSPKQTVEIEVPVETAENFGMSFMADRSVSVSLLDQNGKTVGKNMSDSPFAAVMFRTLFFEQTVTKGIWKLKIENGSDFEQTFIGYGWSVALPANDKIPVAE